MPREVPAGRFWFIYFCIALIFIMLVYQLVQLMVIRQDSLLEAADKQHQMTIKIPPLRGPILDRNGKELGTNLKLPSIYAVPRVLNEQEKDELQEKLVEILELDESFVKRRLDRDKAFVWIKRHVSEEQGQAIEALKHKGLGIIDEYKRFYPQADLLSQVLGFTNIDNQGLEGIELTLNRALSGREGIRRTKRDALGREIRALQEATIPAIDGHKVVLTIDQYLQYLTETALDKAFKKWNAVGGTAIIMNPKTGEILAIANRPGYDPNNFSSSLLEARRNRAVTDVYEPGSVFKIVAATAALNEGVVQTDDIFFCENGQYKYGSRILRDAHGYGDLSFEEVIIKSSNIGTVKIAALLEPEVFQSYIDAFGFGEKTGVDLPGEVSGFTRPPSKWSKTSPYNIPMGHEVLVTALQMVRAFGVVANGGELMRPYIVSHVEDQHGVVLEQTQPLVQGRVMKPEVAETVKNILVRVVDEGTGRNAKIKNVKVGGKTGTAQKVLSGGRGYSHDNFISSFIGFAPAEDPTLVMGVVLDDPKPKYYGGTVSAPVFQEVIEAALAHMGYVPPEEAEPTVSAAA